MKKTTFFAAVLLLMTSLVGFATDYSSINVVSVLTMDCAPQQKADYFSLYYDIDTASIATTLGVPMSSVTLIAPDASSDYIDATNATGGDQGVGFWFDTLGYYNAYDGAQAYFVTYSEGGDSIAIGQYNANLIIGETISPSLGFYYGGNAVLLKINITLVASPGVSGTVVATQKITEEQIAMTSYASDSVKFDLDKVLTDLGISSIGDAVIFGLCKDGSYSTTYTATTGWWNNYDGYVVDYNDTSIVYSDVATGITSGLIYVGQYPSTLAEGNSAKCIVGFCANSKIEIIEITVKIVAPLAYDPSAIVNTQELSLVTDTASGYVGDTIKFDKQTVLTNLGISSMNDVEQLITYDEDGNLTDVVTAVNGFWYNLDGVSETYGDNSAIFIEYHPDIDSSILIQGSLPANLSKLTGKTFVVYYGFYANNKIEMLKVSVTFNGAVGVDEIENDSEIKAYPNPVSGTLYVDLSKYTNGTVSLYSLDGKIVESKQVSSIIETIDMNQLPGGIYLLRYDNESITKILKVIKR